MKLALLFPGQGSQKVGMGSQLFHDFPAARSVFEQADSALGMNLSRLCFEGPEEDLRLTTNTQPAILTTSIAALQALQSEFPLAPEARRRTQPGRIQRAGGGRRVGLWRCGQGGARARPVDAGSLSARPGRDGGADWT